MRRWLVGLLIAVLGISGVAYAADVSAPTLADVYQLLLEVRADVASLKGGGSASTNRAGNLGSAVSADGLVTLTVTSLMAGPDATVLGVAITNNSSNPVQMSTLMDTSLTAGGVQLELAPFAGVSGDILPGTTGKRVLLAGPAPAGASELVFRTELFDTEEYAGVLEAAIHLQLQ